jgi:acetolactate synthase-1/2/3 large subunit
MNCSEYLTDFLIRKGITDIFGFPGGSILPFMDALHQRNREISVHVCGHEQGCSFAADGYARVSGKMGVYFTTSGPGAVNALPGLADAWFDSVPLLGICGNVPLDEIDSFPGARQYGFQEMDIVSMAGKITKYAVTARSGEEFPGLVQKAFAEASGGRKGGVLIDFPYDIQKADTACR